MNSQRASTAVLRAERLFMEELRSRARPADAPIMQAYMKSKLPYLGVKTPEMRAAVKVVAEQLRIQSREDLVEIAGGVFRRAPFREFRHAAIDLTRQRRFTRFIDLDCLPLFEEFITLGAWWDLVDAVAPYRLYELLDAHRAPMTKLMKTWARDDDPWKRRASICIQLKAKEKTDVDLLFHNIEHSFGHEYFFVRKGIGWALRELGKTMPDEVLAFCRKHGTELSTLSKREALRNLMDADELSDFLEETARD